MPSTNVRLTSLVAYNDLLAHGKGSKQRTIVLGYILKTKRPITRTEISYHAHIPINAVCGRVNELLKAGIIREVGKHFCSITGNLAYRVAPIV